MGEWIYLILVLAAGLFAFVTFFLSFVVIATEDKDVFKTWLLSFFICFLLFAFIWFGDYQCSKQLWIIPDEPDSVEHIVALNDNNLIGGRIYARGNYIDNDLWYQYMVKISDNGFVANKLKASTVTLYYTDDDYRVEWWTKTRSWLFFDQVQRFHKIYIPEGSIVNDFTVDLK